MKRFGTIALALLMFLGVLQSHPVCARAEAAEEEFVVVLDPGHGGSDSGAVRTWSGKKYREKLLNLTIASYCRQELEKYAGVEVYMTREDDTYVSLTGRTVLAESVEADLFVSLHNNSGTKTSSRGMCVYYPNMNYRRDLGEAGREAASCIRNRLAALGLKDNGIKSRSSESKTKYPDKKLADYYAVIRQSKLRGIPGIIVEHAYVSNPTDCKTYLSSNAKLRELGIADAMGIADYFGLVLGSDAGQLTAEVQPDGSVALSWEAADGMDGYSVYRRKQGEEEFECLAVLDGGDQTDYTDSELPQAGVYEYSVRAYAEDGDTLRYTAYSDTAEAVWLPAPQQLVCDSTPEGLSRLVWTAVDGADGYVIESRENPEESYLAVARVDAGGLTEWTDEASGGKQYVYRICAFIQTEEAEFTGAYADGSQSEANTE